MTRARGEVDQELEVISKYEQEPEFRNFIKNLLRCRSLASLDINKDAKAEEDEKTARQEKQNDDIERRPVGRGRAQERRRNHQALLSEERSGRGEDGDSSGVRKHFLQPQSTLKYLLSAKRAQENSENPQHFFI